MLIYNKAYDIFHTIFRFLLLTDSEDRIWEIDKLRILDFYFVFPSEMLEIKSFKGFQRYKKVLCKEKNKYERVINRKRVFYKMENIQLSALRAIVSYGLFDADKFKEGKIERTRKELSKELSERINFYCKNNEEIVTLIRETLASMDLYGHLGLKARTNLIDFKYDTK